ncbi:MAG: hypothetical protein WCJ49_02665, partial [Deltaproteobacteria bacterium]
LMSFFSGHPFGKLSATGISDLVEVAGFYVTKKQRIDGIIPLLFLVATPIQPSHNISPSSSKDTMTPS